MKRILFLLLWLIPILGGAQAQGATIEIYVNGHKYDSLQAYLTAKKNAILQNVPTPAELNDQQEDDIRKAAKKLGFNVDFSKVKTFQVDHQNISDTTRHKLYILSVENGVVGALQDFYQTWGQSDIQIPRKITSEQLQEAIQQAVLRSKYPKLLISEPGKMRIMALTANDSTQQ